MHESVECDPSNISYSQPCSKAKISLSKINPARFSPKTTKKHGSIANLWIHILFKLNKCNYAAAANQHQLRDKTHRTGGSLMARLHTFQINLGVSGIII